jgi:hypothetical protein
MYRTTLLDTQNRDVQYAGYRMQRGAALAQRTQHGSAMIYPAVVDLSSLRSYL